MTLAVRASDFIDSLGVNTHLDFGSYGYQNLTVVEQAINYLGFKNLRDSAATSSDLTTWQQVAQATGAKFDDYIGETSQAGMSTYLNLMPQLANEGILNFIEGGNEEDDSYPQSLGNTLQYTAQFQQQVYAMGQQLGLPVINMSFGAGWTSANNWQGDYGSVGDLSAYCDYANAHTYPVLGQTPDYAINRLNGLAQLAASTRPVITTEIGWDLNQGFTQQQVATYALDATMDGIKDGDVKMYFYALFNDGSGQFGLMNQDGTPTQAGTALHDLTTLLADTGANASSFTTGSLNYTLSGTISGDNSLLFEKSDGSYWVSLWNESETAGSPHNITLNLPTAAEVKVFDPLTGTTALSDQTGVTAVTLSLPDHPVLVEVIPTQTTSTTSGSTSGTTQTTSAPDPVISVPSGDSVTAGSTLAITGVSVADPWAAANPGTLALNVWDSAGTLQIGGQTLQPGGGPVSGGMFTGTLEQINADLAGMTYTAPAGATTDQVTVDVWDQAGVEATKSFGVTVTAPVTAPSSSDIVLDPSNPNPIITQDNVSITGQGTFMLFIGGTHDTAILTGGDETVQAYDGYNTITTGAGNDTIRYAGTGNTINAGSGNNTLADSGSGNTIVIPGSGQGFDDVYGYVLQDGDTLDFRDALKGTNWNGSQATLKKYIQVTMSGADAQISISKTAGGSGSVVATLRGSGYQTLTSISSHAIF